MEKEEEEEGMNEELHSLHGRELSDELSIDDSGAELFGDSHFDHVVLVGLSRDVDVNVGALAGVDLGESLWGDCSAAEEEG